MVPETENIEPHPVCSVKGYEMKNRTAVIILKLIPVISAPLAYILMISPAGSKVPGNITAAATLLGFLGFAFFFIGRKHFREDKTVRILSILDIVATVIIIGIYVIAIMVFGL